MMTLTAVNTGGINQTLWFLIIVGVATGMAAIVFISILFSWSTKDIVDNALKLLIFAVITGASVFSIGNLVLNTSQSTQATGYQQMYDWSISKMADGKTGIHFKTTVPTRTYLEYQSSTSDVIPIFSSSSSTKNVTHDFITDYQLTPESVLFVIIDGKKYRLGQ